MARTQSSPATTGDKATKTQAANGQINHIATLRDRGIAGKPAIIMQLAIGPMRELDLVTRTGYPAEVVKRVAGTEGVSLPHCTLADDRLASGTNLIRESMSSTRTNTGESRRLITTSTRMTRNASFSSSPEKPMTSWVSTDTPKSLSNSKERRKNIKSLGLILLPELLPCRPRPNPNTLTCPESRPTTRSEVIPSRPLPTVLPSRPRPSPRYPPYPEFPGSHLDNSSQPRLRTFLLLLPSDHLPRKRSMLEKLLSDLPETLYLPRRRALAMANGPESPEPT
jgi:hypothetical protein